MDWVKLSTRYPRDLAIVRLDDAGEVMWNRGLATAGELESGGFIPDELLPTLTRTPARAPRTAVKLVDAGLWERVDGGYQIVAWHDWQAELERLVAKKKRDRDRKRRDRATTPVRGLSVDASADSPTGNRAIESKRKRKTAAAAAEGAAAAAAVDNLPTSLGIFASKIHAHTRLQALRFDGLTADRIHALEQLVEVHGDDRLVRVALDTCRATPPVHVSAFIGTWEALPAPGQRLTVVRGPECTDHPGQIASNCSGCAADRLAGER